MLEAPIRNRRRGRCLTIALLAVSAAAFASCATEKPRPALVDDPDSQRAASTIPWNKPQNWEGRENFPTGMQGEDTGLGGTRSY